MVKGSVSIQKYTLQDHIVAKYCQLKGSANLCTVFATPPRLPVCVLYMYFQLVVTLLTCTHAEARMADEKEKGKKKVQDAYTLRCIPQVHGVVHDTLKFVRGILTTEMNSATDNPVSAFCRHVVG